MMVPHSLNGSLLALLRDATSHAIDTAFNDAARHGYTHTEIDALLNQPKEW